MEIKQIKDVIWEIEKEGNMNVPVRVIATEKLLQKMKEDRTLIQAMNVASLPGIYKNALVMPDGHEGYGFPIGGVAALDVKEGGVSPGGIGFDINCLLPGTKIVNDLGIKFNIESLEKESTKVGSNGVFLLSLAKKQKMKGFGKGELTYFMYKENDKRVYKIKTLFGKEIIATEDHPILTPKGMKELGKLKVGDEIITYNFDGIEYEEKDGTILKREDFEGYIREELKKRNLIPLKYDEKAGVLARLVGFLIGDGTIYFSKKKGFVCGYGKKEDLEKIKEDIEFLGYSARIYSRERNHEIPTKYGIVKFKNKTYELHVKANSLAAILIKLGVPLGKKTNKGFRVPKWIKEGPKWIKRLFLSGLFSAELSKPSFMPNGKTPYIPTFTQMKNECALKEGHKFFEDLADILNDLDIKIRKITLEEYDKNKNGKTYRLKLFIHEDTENLIRLYSKIGFDYNKGRQRLASLAVAYLTYKDSVVSLRKEIREFIRNSNYSMEYLTEKFGDVVNRRFIERSKWGTTEKARIPKNFPTFSEFVKKFEFKDGFIRDRIIAKEEILYTGKVYDITVEGSHNFLANGIVVSNCGVRLVRTNLKYEEVKPKIKELIDTIFKNVPSGLGSKGKIRVNNEELDEVLNYGVKWAVENGFGWERDLENIEEKGSFEGADAKKVSDKAKKRGRPQLGSLGSGNHFLEVQKVEEVYDEKVAKVFGLEKDQVVVMIHTGSRGLGHQVCSDYLRVFEKAFPDLVEKLPDRELIYAPAGSKELEDYLAAMKAAANYAWTNRHMIMHWTRESFEEVFKKDAESLGMELVYDVAHNIAKIEKYKIDGKMREVYVHRKGATRAFGPGNEALPKKYFDYGQPVLIPGSMGTASYVLVGSKTAEEVTFSSTAHGAGRLMSRHAALKEYRAEEIKEDLLHKGIYIRSASMRGIAEEAPGAYKDIDEVVHASHKAGIGKLVAKLRPMGVVKG